MNTRSTRTNVSTAIASAAVISIVTVVGTGTASVASEPRGSQVNSDSTYRSFGYPLDALGGQSLAEYVSAHWAPVIAVGV